MKPYYVLSHLAKKHDVTLVTWHQGGPPPKGYIKAVEDLGVELHYTILNPVKAGIISLFRLPLKYPLEISFYYQSELKKIVNKLLEEREFDLGFSFFMRTADYIRNHKMKKILMAEDCRTEYQRRSSRESTNILQKAVRFWEVMKLKHYEPEIVNHFDAATFVTREDIELMKKMNPDANYKLLTNGTDVDSYVPPDNPERKGILFAGRLDIWANVLMLRETVKEILPRIREKIPEAQFNIVGARPPAEVKALVQANNHVTLTSDVPEMRPFLQEAAVFLHPHAGGSGIQNKLLEAMACGCPVVTTPTGNQGIYAKHEEEAMIGRNPEELAEHTVRILKDKDFAEMISRNCRSLMVRTHSWDIVYKQLDQMIEEICGSE